MVLRDRVWWAIRYEQLKRLAPAIGFILQAGTLSGVLYSLTAWKIGWGWILLPIFFTLILIFSIFGAWFYYEVLGMKDSEQEARFRMEPQYVEVLSPQQAWMIEILARALEGDKKALIEMKKAAKTGRIAKLDMNRKPFKDQKHGEI